MLTKRTLIRTAIKSFFIQALWNFEKMQNIGMMFVLMHPLSKIYRGDAQGYHNALKRHLDFFNIHPYMANIVIGVVLGLEERVSLNNEDLEAEINTVKSTMAGPLSAIGDSFFWGLWRPVVTLLVCLAYFLFFNVNDYSLAGTLFIVFGFLVIYNIPHIILRFKALRVAYRQGTSVIVYIKKWQDFKIEAKLKLLGFLLLLGIFVIFLIRARLTLLEFGKLLAIFLVVEILKHKKASTVKIIISVLCVFILLAYLKVV
ncbi:MAG: PTS system mannose/fructose/sorbose family transporter subunit IID [bacterium]|nr:PTS system mannose/fructose/sorbose family transporter subunit IID [bacterium]